jgi:hypothetical protein
MIIKTYTVSVSALRTTVRLGIHGGKNQTAVGALLNLKTWSKRIPSAAEENQKYDYGVLYVSGIRHVKCQLTSTVNESSDLLSSMPGGSSPVFFT